MNFLTRNQDTEFHFMVDIETLATSNNAAITEIGAVTFAQIGDGLEMFHIHCVDTGGEWSDSTVQWRKDNNLPWAGPGDAAGDIDYALKEFFAWIKQYAAGRRPVLWCKGTDFDAVIITNAARRNNIVELPWKYNDINDVRTLLRLWPQFKVSKEEVKHNGLTDAVMQFKYLVQIADHVATLESCPQLFAERGPND